MSIRAKLALNAVTVLAIVAAIVLSSDRGMRSVEANIWALTQKSTPFQLRSVELEKAVQLTVGALGNANNAKSVEEFKAYQADASRSLVEVRENLDGLKALSGEESGAVYQELQGTAAELIAVSDSRLKAQAELEVSAMAAADKLKGALAHLSALSQRVEKLQQESAARFQTAVAGMKESTASARDVEALKLSVASLRVLLFQLARAGDKDGVVLYQGKCAGELENAVQNPYVKQSRTVQDALQDFRKRVQELSAKKAAALEKPSDAAAEEIETLIRDADDTVSDMILSTRDDSSKFKNHYESEAKRQDEAFKSANAASAVLVGSMELGAAGRAMDSLSARLFTAATPSQVTAVEGEMKAVHGRATEVGKRLAAALTLLQAKADVATAQGVVGELGEIFRLVAGSDGMTAKVARSLELNDKAHQMSRRLLETAARQKERSRKGVDSARGDQEEAIRTVYSSLRRNTTVIRWSGAVAVLFGLGFGFWIYGSVVGPLRRLSQTASDVARNGDFSKRIPPRGRDEIAATVNAFNGLLESLYAVIQDVSRVMANVAAGDLTTSVQVEATGDLESLKRSINESVATLSRTIAALGGHAQQSSAASAESTRAVDQVAVSSRQQFDAVSRVAAAIQQSAATMGDVAENTEAASREAQRAAQVVGEGQAKVAHMALAMRAISENSAKITGISGVILDVADQTNLLALNAAIEAAWAGEHGRGFAVVAEEVTKLSEKVTALARDIASVVQESVRESATAVKEASQVEAEMARIAGASEEIEDMLRRIASAVEEQSATVTSLSLDVTTLNEIAETNASASEQLAAALVRLAALGKEASRQVGYFRT